MRRWWRGPRTLSTRMALLVVALAAPMLLVIAAAYGDSLRDRRSIEVAAATNAARNSASIVESFLRDLESTTFASAGLLGTTTGPIDQATYGAYLASVSRIYPELRAYFFADATGRVVASASGEGIGTDLSARSYMATLRSGAPTVWSGSIAGLQSGDITVAFGRPIVAPSGGVKGYVVTAFYPERVIQALRPDYPADARLVLIDERGRLLYDSARTEPATAEIDLSNAPGVRQALSGSLFAVDGAATPLGSEPGFGAIVPIARTGWALAVTRPMAALESQLAGRLLGNTMAILVTLAVAASLATLIANRLASPLRDLSHVASAIARGERPVIPVASGGVEVEQLSAAMRAMESSVARREDELHLLASAGESLSGTLDHAEAIRRASRVAIPALADWCLIEIVEGGIVSLAAVAAADAAGDDSAARLRESLPPAKVEERHGPGARAIVTRAPVVGREADEALRDAVADDAGQLDLWRAIAPRSLIAVPLMSGDRPIGAVTLVHAGSGRTYTASDVDLARQLARRIALSLENARLYYEVQQSLRTRDDFLSAVAHELKTPLTVISATAQMIQRREPDRRESTAAMSRILGSVGRMTVFIEELLDLIRRPGDIAIELRRESVDLAEIARSVAAEAAQLGHGQTIRVEAEGPVVGAWDGRRLERAIANLIGNAVKYNRPEGTVTVRVGTEIDGDEPLAFVSVSDEGVGIPPTDRARIFERFARGANVAGRIGGTGVGLAIVRQVVEQHGGTVDVVSVEGRGSTFTLRLPLAAAAAATA